MRSTLRIAGLLLLLSALLLPLVGYASGGPCPDDPTIPCVSETPPYYVVINRSFEDLTGTGSRCQPIILNHPDIEGCCGESEALGEANFDVETNVCPLLADRVEWPLEGEEAPVIIYQMCHGCMDGPDDWHFRVRLLYADGTCPIDEQNSGCYSGLPVGTGGEPSSLPAITWYETVKTSEGQEVRVPAQPLGKARFELAVPVEVCYGKQECNGEKTIVRLRMIPDHPSFPSALATPVVESGTRGNVTTFVFYGVDYWHTLYAKVGGQGFDVGPQVEYTIHPEEQEWMWTISATEPRIDEKTLFFHLFLGVAYRKGQEMGVPHTLESQPITVRTTACWLDRLQAYGLVGASTEAIITAVLTTVLGIVVIGIRKRRRRQKRQG